MIEAVIAPENSPCSPAKNDVRSVARRGSSPHSPAFPLMTCDSYGAMPEARLVYLVWIGAIDPEDAELVRERWHAYREEWVFLLDCCEAAWHERRSNAPAASHPQNDLG